MNRLIKTLPFLFVLLLVGCGGYTEAEEKVKDEMKILNTYVEDQENPEFDDELEQSIIANMTPEEITEREVEVELGLRDNVEGNYETYGIDEDTEPYVEASIEQGLAIPKDGRVVEVVNGEDDNSDNDSRDDLSVLMDNQRERLGNLEVRQQTQEEIDDNDVNLKIITALRERKGQIESEIEDKRNQSENSDDLGLDKQISELEEELEELEANNRLTEDGGILDEDEVDESDVEESEEDE